MRVLKLESQLLAERGNVDASARSHRRRYSDVFQVNPFCRCRFGTVQSVDQRLEVLSQLLGVERHFADRCMDLTCTVKAVFDLTGFDLLNSLRHVERYRAGFRVRHEAFTAEDTSELADFSHHVRRSHADIEFEPALLNFVDHVRIADEVSACSFGFLRFVAFGEYEDALCFARTVREYNDTANGLVLFPRVDAQTDSHFDGFVEFGGCCFFHELDCFRRLVSRFAVDQLSGFNVFLAMLCHEEFLLMWCVAERLTYSRPSHCETKRSRCDAAPRGASWISRRSLRPCCGQYLRPCALQLLRMQRSDPAFFVLRSRGPWNG
ncbi:hypothetical protein BN871_AB_00490 [Paenibacillus sp. P22]|nr:hypothetical protein BN871_AB_00490 [Paenibacillus sp. P22]